MRITSKAFEHGQPIPRQYTGDGEDVSPPLEWENVPDAAQELALICEDPDAPKPPPWVHWVIYSIASDVHALPEHMPPTARTESPVAACQGRNSWSHGTTIGYRGPAPPPGHGTHHYHFKLYALDAKLHVMPGSDKETLLQTMSGHVLGEAELVGTYER